MPSQDTKILEFNQNQKSTKVPFVIYADLECIIEKIDGCKTNSGNSSTIKVGEHILWGFSMSIISSSKSIENNYKFCESLRQHAMKIIIFFKKMKLLTKEQQESI